MNDILVSMEGIEKTFPGVHALKQCQFELRRGEVHALVGENGAGKSTMMKVLTGVYQKEAGSICVNGQEVIIPHTRAAQDMGISIIHQELNLAADLTVAQNIYIGREPRKMMNLFLDEKKMNEQTKALFERLNLPVMNPRTLVSELTVAKQQMVEIAKALSFDAQVLIMDEPTAALSETEIEDLFQIIRGLRSRGVGVVYISHRMNELKQITDRITVMRDGSYIDTVDTPKISVDEIISMMVGREIYHSSNHLLVDQQQPNVLEVQNLNRGRMVKDVSFELKKGEILGFAGLVGAGRTEVARAVFGADRVESGEILIKGKAVKVDSPFQAVKNGIGYLSEDRKLFGCMIDLDVKTNIASASFHSFINRIGWINRKKIAKVSRDIVESLKVKTPSIHQEVKFLSGGNQQKVVIGKWLTRDCDILIFDEPTRGIDVGAKSEIYKLLDKLTKQGKSIIMISSELPEILRMSHRIAVMCEGRITGILDREEASQEAIMSLATRRNEAL